MFITHTCRNAQGTPGAAKRGGNGVRAGAQRSAFTGVEDGGLRFHGLTTGKLETKEQEFKAGGEERACGPNGQLLKPTNL